MGTKVFEKALEYINRFGLVEKGDSIIAGVSGGADSMCMLLILLELKESLRLEITVAHVNHGIRGAEAERDADFVRSFCEKKGIAFELASVDIPRLSKETGTTCEEAGRNFRYGYFCELAAKYRAKKIAVAHNSDDNAETVLFNIFRGSGIGGLKGILPSRSIKAADGSELTVIRPVLTLSRAEIEDYLSEIGQGFCIDSTNSGDAYARNRLRNTILPMVRDTINSNVYGHIGALSRQAASISDYIEQEIKKNAHIISLETDGKGAGTVVSIDCKEILRLHPVLRKSLIRTAFEMAAGRLKDVEEGHIEAIDELRDKQSGRRISMPYGITALKEYDRILLLKSGSWLSGDASDAETRSGKSCKEKVDCAKGRVTVRGITFEVVRCDELPKEIPNEKSVKWFDYEKTGTELELRTPFPGDYLLIGKDGHRKPLNRFMIDSKIPLSEREKVLCLSNGSHVLWVVGFRQDESCLVTDATRQVLVAKNNAKEKVK